MRRFAVVPRCFTVVALAAGLLLAGAAPAAAQSLLANRGLGLVVEPQDARSAGLGGVRLGLGTGQLSWANPAELVGLAAPGLRASFQMDAFEAEYDERSADGTTARFPLALVGFPIGERWAVAVGFGGMLDQNWAVERDDTLLIGEDSVAVSDRLSSEGGVVRLRFGGAYRVLEPLSLGAAVDLYTGSVQRRFGRRFPDNLQASVSEAEWSYSGVGGTLGLAWRPYAALDLSLSASFGGTLDAESESEEDEGASYSLPTTYRAGASARVGSATLLAVSADWAGWSSLDGALDSSGGARDSWSLQGGVEWDGLQIGERALPIRLGARTSALPFQFGASGTDGWTSERAVSLGGGLVLAGGAARGDLALERGRRSSDGGGLDESFSRVTFSVTVLGR